METDSLIKIDSCYLNRVEELALLGYSPERIVSIIDLDRTKSAVLLLKLNLPNDEFYEAYHKGLCQGEEKMDSSLHAQADDGDIDAIKLIQERNALRQEQELRKKLFGV